ncbi:MAG: heavy metal-associated domain-containing protein [Cyclobacteriaceae bacterium]
MKKDQNKSGYRPYPLKRLISGYLFLVILALGACSQPEQQKEERAKGQVQSEQLKTVTIPIEGMTCNACVASVKRKFKSMEGLEKAEVSLVHRNATLTYDPDKITPRQIRNAIHEVGYKADEPITETNR